MVITEKIVKEVTVSYSGVFDLHDFIDYLKKELKKNGYDDITEKQYDSKVKGDAKTVKIKWECVRKPTDYDKFVVKITIEGSNLKEGEVDGLKVVEGDVKVEFNAEHEKDYDEKWKKKPTFNFIRAIYDKYIIEEKQQKYDKKLKSDVETLTSEVKRYFNIKE
jgi:hypothetical protein